MRRRFDWITLNLLLGCLVSGISGAVAAPSTHKLCVLNYERKEHGITPLLDKIFAHNPDTEVRHMALPTDLLECIQGGSEEILLVAHELVNPGTERTDLPSDLGYFRDLQGEERKQAIAENIATLTRQLEVLKKSQPSPGPDARQRILALTQTIEKYRNFPADRPYYVTRSFLTKIMERVRDELKRQAAASPQGVKLKKIRWMTCGPERVFKRYPDLEAAIRENGITLEIAPKSVLMSWIEGAPVTAPDFNWLAKSVNCQKLDSWQTEQNSRCRYDFWPGCDRAQATYCIPSE